MSEAKIPKTDSEPNQEAELTKEAIGEKQEKAANVDVDKDYDAAEQYKTGVRSNDKGEGENKATPSL